MLFSLDGLVVGMLIGFEYMVYLGVGKIYIVENLIVK